MKEYRTQYRDWMLDYFEAHRDALFSPAHIYRDMQAAGFSVNQATVYRNLDHLEKEGKIHGHHVAGHDETYYQYLDPVHDCSHHLHCYCRKCGKVIHMDEEFMEQMQSYLQKHDGFELDCRDSVLIGLCDACRKEEEKK